MIRSPLIWECTRFCLAPDAPMGVAAALLAAGVELGLRFGLEQALGVVYAKTIPIYRRIGSCPDIIGARGEGADRIAVGLWPISVEARAEISRRSGIPLVGHRALVRRELPGAGRRGAAGRVSLGSGGLLGPGPVPMLASACRAR